MENGSAKNVRRANIVQTSQRFTLPMVAIMADGDVA